MVVEVKKKKIPVQVKPRMIAMRMKTACGNRRNVFQCQRHGIKCWLCLV